MGSGRTETPMPADVLLSQVVDVGYCPTCRYRLTAHDFGCDAIGRLVLQHQCRGSAVVPCQYVPSVNEVKGSAGYSAAEAAGAYRRKETPLCACGCGELAATRRNRYAASCLKRLRSVWAKEAGEQTKRSLAARQRVAS